MKDDVGVDDQLEQTVEMGALVERNPTQPEEPEAKSRQVKGQQQLFIGSGNVERTAVGNDVSDTGRVPVPVPLHSVPANGGLNGNSDEVHACLPPDGIATDGNTKLSAAVKRERPVQHVKEEEGITRQGSVDSVIDALMREKNYNLVRDSSGNSFADYVAFSIDDDRGAAMTEKEERRLLTQWLATKVDAKQFDILHNNVANFPTLANMKRSRENPIDSTSLKPAKSARITPVHIPIPIDSSPAGIKPARRRYTIAELLALRHDRKNESLNRYSFSKNCAPPDAVVVSQVDELAIAADGRLRSTDVLLSVVNAAAPTTFESMMLPSAVVQGLRKAGFTTPSPVQYRGIPVGRLGTDVVAQAKSGTGKTVVFAVLIAEIVLKSPPGQVVALVLAPTREIARQIAHVVRSVLPDESVKTGGKNGGKGGGKGGKRGVKDGGRSVALLVGGTPERKDKDALRVARVAVGTPGRVRALLERGTFNGASVRMLVLDEADRLLDASAGFALGSLVGCLGEQRQTLAFSATYTPKLVARLRRIMRMPQLVWLGDERAVGADDDGAMHRGAVLQAVKQFQMHVRGYGVKAKGDVFVKMLSVQEFSGCIAFAGQRDAVAHYAKRARKAGFAAKHVSAVLNGKERKMVVEEFEKGRINVLVCTDLLARGVSFEMCDFVVQLDVAINTETHLHRVGRAGRFGTTGVGVVVVEEGQRAEMREIERDIGGLPEWPYAKEILGDENTSTAAPSSRMNDADERTAESESVIANTGGTTVSAEEYQRADMREIERGIGRLSERTFAQKILEDEITTTAIPPKLSTMKDRRTMPDVPATENESVMAKKDGTVTVAAIVEDENGNEKADVEDDATQEAKGKCSYDMPVRHGSWENAIPQPQNLNLRGGNMSSTRAQGFAHGYSRACDLISRLSANR